jgi:hypothetical protein
LASHSAIHIHFANAGKKKKKKKKGEKNLATQNRPGCRVITTDGPPKITQFSSWSERRLLPLSAVLNGMTHALRCLHPHVVAFQDIVTYEVPIAA